MCWTKNVPSGDVSTTVGGVHPNIVQLELLVLFFKVTWHDSIRSEQNSKAHVIPSASSVQGVLDKEGREFFVFIFFPPCLHRIYTNKTQYLHASHLTPSTQNSIDIVFKEYN